MYPSKLERHIRNVRLIEPRVQVQDPNESFNRVRDPPILRWQLDFDLKLATKWHTYKIIKFLGGGAEGEVYEARLQSQPTDGEFSPRKIAVKFVKNGNREIDILESIPQEAYDHKNLVRYRGFVHDAPEFKEICSYPHPLGLIIMDLCMHGSIVDWIQRRHRSNRKHFPESIAQRIMRDLIKGLAHLRTHGVSHRDIKSDNIFLDCQGKFVIGDFGHCCLLTSTSTARDFGTLEYNPPECVHTSGPINSEKVDIFQLGTVFFSLLTGCLVWKGQPLQVFKRTDLDIDPINNSTSNKRFWDKWERLRSSPKFIERSGEAEPLTQSAKNLINRLWGYDPRYRPTFKELMDALEGNSDDRSLDFLKVSDDYCTLVDLYEELHERIADDTQEEIEHFYDITKRWKSCLSKLKAVSAISGESYKRGRSTSDSSPIPMTRQSSSNASTETDIREFARITEQMIEEGKDPMCRPVLKWYLNLDTSSGIGLRSFVDELVAELKNAFNSSDEGDNITGENPAYEHYDSTSKTHDTKWSVDIEMMDKRGKAILGFTMKLELHSNDHGEFNGTLEVRRNFGNGLHVEAHILSVFDSPELQKHWKLCKETNQPLSPLPHSKGQSKPWMSVFADATARATAIIQDYLPEINIGTVFKGAMSSLTQISSDNTSASADENKSHVADEVATPKTNNKKRHKKS